MLTSNDDLKLKCSVQNFFILPDYCDRLLCLYCVSNYKCNIWHISFQIICKKKKIKWKC